MATRKITRYGWRPQLPDPRDYPANPEIGVAPPSKADLCEQISVPIYDQGELGSCTANAGGFAYEYEAIRQGEPIESPSRLFIYYEERAMEGTVDSDAGAQVRDCLKVLATKGAPPETDWPYDIAKFAVRPSDKAYTDGVQRRAIEYRAVNRSLHSKKCCIAQRQPIVFGFTVFESFESSAVAQSGVMSMPRSGEQIVGGHAVAAVGYDDSRQMFKVRNSWGPNWGQEGYFWMPYAYILDPSLASDFWTIKTVS